MANKHARNAPHLRRQDFHVCCVSMRKVLSADLAFLSFFLAHFVHEEVVSVLNGDPPKNNNIDLMKDGKKRRPSVVGVRKKRH